MESSRYCALNTTHPRRGGPTAHKRRSRCKAARVLRRKSSTHRHFCGSCGLQRLLGLPVTRLPEHRRARAAEALAEFCSRFNEAFPLVERSTAQQGRGGAEGRGLVGVSGTCEFAGKPRPLRVRGQPLPAAGQSSPAGTYAAQLKGSLRAMPEREKKGGGGGCSGTNRSPTHVRWNQGHITPLS